MANRHARGTCFLCSEPTSHVDRNTGEFICGKHNSRRFPQNPLSETHRSQTHFRRLLWCYQDHDLALSKWLGEDPETIADVAAWRMLGRDRSNLSGL